MSQPKIEFSEKAITPRILAMKLGMKPADVLKDFLAGEKGLFTDKLGTDSVLPWKLVERVCYDAAGFRAVPSPEKAEKGKKLDTALVEGVKFAIDFGKKYADVLEATAPKGGEKAAKVLADKHRAAAQSVQKLLDLTTIEAKRAKMDGIA